jgi:hypothetical protein
LESAYIVPCPLDSFAKTYISDFSAIVLRIMEEGLIPIASAKREPPCREVLNILEVILKTPVENRLPSDM